MGRSSRVTNDGWPIWLNINLPRPTREGRSGAILDVLEAAEGPLRRCEVLDRLDGPDDLGLVARTLYQLWKRGAVERPEEGSYGL